MSALKQPPAREHADVYGMKKVGVRPPLRKYLRHIWAMRHFILEESRGRSFQSVRGTILGRLWLLAEPFINTALYLVMFGMILRTDRGIDNFLGYLFVGSIMFTWTITCFGSAGAIISAGQGLIRSFTFPRAALVLAFVSRSFINALPSFGAMLVFVMVVPPHAFPSITWAAFPALLVLQTVFNLGLSFALAVATAHVPDLKFIWRLISQFWFWASGIFFSIEHFVDHPVIVTAMEANPAYTLVQLYRDLLLYQRWGPLSSWLYFAAWAIGLAVVGFLAFWRSEESYGRLNDR